MATYLKRTIDLEGSAAINGHFEVTLKCKKGFLEIFRKTECLDVVGIFKKYLHFKSNNSLNFVGGAATDAHFEVTLKCKKGFFGIFSQKLIY